MFLNVKHLNNFYFLIKMSYNLYHYYSILKQTYFRQLFLLKNVIVLPLKFNLIICIFHIFHIYLKPIKNIDIIMCP